MKVAFFILLIVMAIKCADGAQGWIIYSTPLRSANEASFKLLNDRISASYNYGKNMSVLNYCAPFYKSDGISVGIYITPEVYNSQLSVAEKALVITSLPIGWEDGEMNFKSSLVDGYSKITVPSGKISIIEYTKGTLLVSK